MNDFRKTIESPKSFPEDYSLENGNYFNTCIECKSTFCGYKRRIICKQCSKLSESEVVEKLKKHYE